MKKLSVFSVCILFCFELCFSQTASKSDGQPYILFKKIPVEGEGKWDLLTMDEPDFNLYLSHGNQVQALDVRMEKVVASLKAGYTNGIHGIAIANDLNKGFFSNGKDTSVSVFNLKTYKISNRIKVTGINPDMILYDKFSHSVFAFNGKSSNATVIKADSSKITGTIALPGKPELAVCDGMGKIYLNIEDKSVVCVINATTLQVENTWKIHPGKEASGIALDLASHRLFIVCDNKLMVIMNADNGKVVQSLPIGEKPDGVVFDPEFKRIFSSNGDGTLTIVQEDNANSFRVIQTLNTMKGAKTIAINTISHFIYIPVAEYIDPPIEEKENTKTKPRVKANSFKVLVIKQDE